MTEEDIKGLVAGMTPPLVDFVKTSVGKVVARVDALEARLASLEAQPHQKFCGVWRGGAFEPGDTVTHAGSLWVCLSPTSGAPGEDFVGWQLAVKRGEA